VIFGSVEKSVVYVSVARQLITLSHMLIKKLHMIVSSAKLKRHFDTKHSQTFAHCFGQERKEKIESLIRNLGRQK
jgi:hypothetical protein